MASVKEVEVRTLKIPNPDTGRSPTRSRTADRKAGNHIPHTSSSRKPKLHSREARGRSRHPEAEVEQLILKQEATINIPYPEAEVVPLIQKQEAVGPKQSRHRSCPRKSTALFPFWQYVSQILPYPLSFQTSIFLFLYIFTYSPAFVSKLQHVTFRNSVYGYCI